MNQKKTDQIDSQYDPAKRSTDEDSNKEKAFNMGVSNQDAEIEVDVSTFSNIELIKKGEEYTENLELEKAVQIYDEGLRRFPNDTVIMDAYTDLLLQMDQTQKAREIIERSIQLNPNKEGLKYLNFAEMLRGHESL